MQPLIAPPETSNMYSVLVTCPTFHEPIGWSKALPRNMYRMFVTCPTSHAASGWLNADA